MNCVWPNAPAQEPLKRSRCDVAARDDLDRREKLAAEKLLPAADTRERRGRADHIAIAFIGAEIRFDAPDRSDDIRIDTVSLLDPLKGRAVLREHLAALIDTALHDKLVDIIPDRFRELRLTIHQLDNFHVRVEIARFAIVDCLRNAARVAPACPTKRYIA
jgi:hypothetical protein